MVTKTGAAHQAAGLTALPTALDYLGSFPQFILWRSDPKPSGKLDKVPLSPENLQPVSAHDPVNWMTAKVAFAGSRSLNDHRYGVGFVLTADDDLFCLDVDGCLDGANWKPIVTEVTKALPGAAIEVSVSGNGLHVWGRYSRQIDHACKNIPLGLELYTQKRFIALGRPDATGKATTDCTAGLSNAIARWFEPGGDGAMAANVWTAEPCPDWNGPADDDELIAKARQSRSKNVFNGKATFNQLWNSDIAALEKSYPPQSAGSDFDHSSAELGLANLLAFWTGKNCERIERLMRRSALAAGRDYKWARDDYLKGTILKAVAGCSTVYGKDYKDTEAVPTTAPRVIPDIAALTKPGELDIAKVINEKHADAHCFSVDSGLWYVRAPGKLWRLDKRAIQLRILIGAYMDFYGMKRGNCVSGVIKLLEPMLADRKPWDNDPYLLGLPDDRVLDVRNGEKRDAHKGDRITRRLAVMPEAGETETWIKVLRETHANKPDVDAVIRYLQVFAGYALTGLTNTQKFLFLVRPPAGGKGTFINTLAGIWGIQQGEGYATSIPSDALLDGRSQHAQWLTLFDGPRLAFVGESNNDSSNSKGGSWRVGDLRTVTAFDPMSANKMRQDSYTFQPTAKLIIGANNVPNMRRFDEALRRRLVLIRCDNPVPNNRQDIHLAEKLRAESGQILTWALEGAAEYCRNGLPPMPDSVQNARDEYLETQDTFGEFLDARFIKAPGQFISAETLRAHHNLRLHGNSYGAAWSDRLRNQEMVNRGYFSKQIRVNGKMTRGFLGLQEKISF